MGWTSKSCSITHNDFTVEEASEFLMLEFGRYDIIHEAYLHKDDIQHEIYALLENRKTKCKYILVILVQIQQFEIIWKEITDSMGPNYFNCPVEILDKSDSREAHAIEWRLLCKRVNSKPLKIPVQS